jgi:hypothetical protein
MGYNEGCAVISASVAHIEVVVMPVRLAEPWNLRKNHKIGARRLNKPASFEPGR